MPGYINHDELQKSTGTSMIPYPPKKSLTEIIKCHLAPTKSPYWKALWQFNRCNGTATLVQSQVSIIVLCPRYLNHANEYKISQTLINEWRDKIPIDAISKAKYKAKEICESLKIKRGKIKNLVVGEVHEKYLSGNFHISFKGTGSPDSKFE